MAFLNLFQTLLSWGNTFFPFGTLFLYFISQAQGVQMPLDGLFSVRVVPPASWALDLLFGAMGGDLFSVININPAGLGAYRKKWVYFSPLPTIALLPSFVDDANTFTKDRYNPFHWQYTLCSIGKNGSGFAIGFSKLADLNKNFSFSGTTRGSITQRFAERANGRDVNGLDDFEVYPIYAVGAIYDPQRRQKLWDRLWSFWER